MSLDAFMAAMGIDKAHFIGNSMGGQAALKLAVDHPARVDKLVVIGSGVIKAGSIFQPMPLEGIRNIANYYKDGGPSIAKMRQLAGKFGEQQISHYRRAGPRTV